MEFLEAQHQLNLGIDRLTNQASLLRLLSSLESGAIQPTADIGKDLEDALVAIAIPSNELAFPVVYIANLAQSLAHTQRHASRIVAKSCGSQWADAFP